MKSEERAAKEALHEANARLQSANVNGSAAYSALQAASSVVARETNAVEEAQAAYARAIANTANYS